MKLLIRFIYLIIIEISLIIDIWVWFYD